LYIQILLTLYIQEQLTKAYIDLCRCMYTGYPGRMNAVDADKYAPIRAVRIEDELWDNLGSLVGPRKRSKLIREFIRWYLRMPGAKSPRRPKSES